jgi:hypothetical protein
MESGSFYFSAATRFDPTRWKGQIKQFMKCKFLKHLPSQAINQDHILRGVVVPTKAAIFWVGADGSSVSTLDKASFLTVGAGKERAIDDTEGTWKNCIAWLIPTALVLEHTHAGNHGTTPLWSLGRLHVLTSAPPTMGGQWRISLSPPASEPGNMTMMVTDYQGPLISVFLALPDGQAPDPDAQDPDADPTEPFKQCSGPVRAILHWTSPPICDTVNVFNGLFPADAAFDEMPPALTERLDDEQRGVLSGISCSTKCVHLVDALAGTGKSHLARCLINRWGDSADPKKGFLVVALRTRTLHQEFLETVLSDKAPRSSDQLLSFALVEKVDDFERQGCRCGSMNTMQYNRS